VDDAEVGRFSRANAESSIRDRSWAPASSKADGR
jgi:hypothetical protein